MSRKLREHQWEQASQRVELSRRPIYFWKRRIRHS